MTTTKLFPSGPLKPIANVKKKGKKLNYLIVFIVSLNKIKEKITYFNDEYRE